MQVFHIPQQELARALILGRVDGLREVDDHGAIRSHQDVEFRKVTVYHAGAEHADDFSNQLLEDPVGLLRAKFQVAESWGGISIGIPNQFHHQYTVDEVDGLGNPYTAAAHAIERVDLGVSPSGLVLFATVARALVDGPLIASVAGFSTLGVLDSMLESSLIRLFVDLGDAFLAAGDDHIDLSLLTTHEWPDDFLDDSVVHQSLETLGGLHARSSSGKSERLQHPVRSQHAPGTIRLSMKPQGRGDTAARPSVADSGRDWIPARAAPPTANGGPARPRIMETTRPQKAEFV